mmetsp:Transcript_25894/g.34656  ORF Transcript_25894/g.34656 Transcript_25894/m.34656 type:complete len:234 (-) Transcript_25894:612-1313(-)
MSSVPSDLPSLSTVRAKLASLRIATSPKTKTCTSLSTSQARPATAPICAIATSESSPRTAIVLSAKLRCTSGRRPTMKARIISVHTTLTVRSGQRPRLTAHCSKTVASITPTSSRGPTAATRFKDRQSKWANSCSHKARWESWVRPRALTLSGPRTTHPSFTTPAKKCKHTVMGRCSLAATCSCPQRPEMSAREPTSVKCASALSTIGALRPLSSPCKSPTRSKSSHSRNGTP